MSTVVMFVVIVAAVALLYGLLVAATTFRYYRPTHTVRCPETGKPVRVHLDATIAALTAVTGPARLRVDQCELWPGRENCDQRCTRSLG
jgi:hypothetical protein